MRTLVSGVTCLLTDAAGNVTDSGGFFVADTRHLSRWVLTVHGRALRALATDAGEVVLAPPTVRNENPPFVLRRVQRLGSGLLTEELTLTSFVPSPQTVRVAFSAEADFADQFELRSSRLFDKSDANRDVTAEDASLVFGYERRGFQRETRVTASPPARLSHDGAQWTVTVPPHGSVVLRATVASGDAAAVPAPSPVVSASADDLDRCVARGLADLDTLRVPAEDLPLPGVDLPAGTVVPAAGAPWFLTLFGRDSLLTSLFALPYRPELAEGTLRLLAATQGREHALERIEQPGKILHELRRGELATLGEVPYARYYGTVDATPLFLVLLAEHHAVTGDDIVAKDLEPAARAAVAWMLDDGGLAATGYLRYPTDAPGLVHHCWKDSADALVFADGAPATGPIAVCEAQGYAYRALRGTAELARSAWGDPTWAVDLDKRADRLRAMFSADFRLPNAFVALALDGADRQVDALASNAGHVLWSGILDDSWAALVGERLAADDFFSGWGIRTLAEGQPPYHPLSYHRGGVWPHDTALAVAGLARAGQRDAAARIADGLVAAASTAGGRLPEVLTGLGRRPGQSPVPYPHSCSPQAWAAASPLLLRTALG
ncbi:amylo-alpha-1,6-glucosidase [Asanoa siamensis]|uniref:Aminotransferase n=1 Tax=Asanoa siamensis TaxID=926357 RepID=A0ABQ4D1S0_9ACTN|nr:glycogen debranching N-terminal domain-containing protein [Asanoa siamensis]GIF77488.1 aminotransferase [Asanoa siamensis]